MSNLISNGNFDDPNDPSLDWEAFVFNGTIDIGDLGPDTAQTPPNCTRAQSDITEPGLDTSLILQHAQIPLDVGQTYEISFWIKPGTTSLAAPNTVFLEISNGAITFENFQITDSDITDPNEYNQIVRNFTWNPNNVNDVLILRVRTAYSADTEDPSPRFYDTFALVAVISPICFSGDSFVYAKNMKTGKICNVRAREIIPGLHQVYNTKKQAFVPVKYNIRSGPTTRYMLIKKNAFEENKPSEDFYVTSGHILMVDGVPVKARDLPQAERIKVKPETVYTICTDRGCPILINNLDVMAYGYQKFISYAKEKGIKLPETKSLESN